MAQPVSAVTQSFVDYSKEKSSVRLFVTTITGANFATVATNITALLAAQAALTLGNADHSKTQSNQTFGPGTPSGNVNAQREKKWLVRYHDTSSRKFTAEIPCSDLSLLATNSDFMDPLNAAYTAYKSAFEAVVVSPDDGSGVTLDSIEFVGRRG